MMRHLLQRLVELLTLILFLRVNTQVFAMILPRILIFVFQYPQALMYSSEGIYLCIKLHQLCAYRTNVVIIYYRRDMLNTYPKLVPLVKILKLHGKNGENYHKMVFISGVYA